MTLGGYMMGQFSIAQYADFFVRILVACLCGATIGFERSLRFKEAGIRTHIIVCCAASLMMLVSKYGFADLTDPAGAAFPGVRGADPARIAAQVVSGVSFIGAGIIFRNGTSIRGLTTAAGLWATAGIGLCIGSGLYIVGVFATAVVALLQVLMHKHVMNADLLVIGHMHCTVMHSNTFRKALADFVDKNKMQIIANKIAFNDDGSTTYDITMRMPPQVTMNDIMDFLGSNDGVREMRCELG